MSDCFELGHIVVRVSDTFVVSKLDRLARSVPDARQIGDNLAASEVLPKVLQQKKLVRMRNTGDHPISDLTELLSASRPTVYRTIARQKAPIQPVGSTRLFNSSMN